MISCEAYTELHEEIALSDVCDFSIDELLTFILRMIIKYSSPRHLHKIIKIEDALEIAKMWIKGQEYYIIQSMVELYDYRILRRNKEQVMSLEEIVSICDSDFGYTASLIINSICEILKSNDISDESDDDEGVLETIEELEKLSQRLKYGLPEQTDIFVYELGFNDRYLAQEISKQSVKKGVTTNILIEVNIGGELSKSGVDLTNAEEIIESVSSLDGICLQGLMAMLPKSEDTPYLEKLCLQMRELYDKMNKKGYNFKHLSVGMSADYKIAIRCGSNMIRLGSSLFGKRDYQK
jgi:hypothetical protein